MLMRRCIGLAAVVLLVSAAAVRAESKVTLSDMHLCCGACVRAVDAAVAKVEGASAAVDRQAKTVTITAKDDETAQAAVDAIAAAGYHGKSSSDKIAMKNDSGAGEDKVTRLVFVGVHNCCGGCAKALQGACGKVDGVEGTAIKAKARSFVVEGNFAPAAIVKALYAAGFHAKVQKDE